VCVCSLSFFFLSLFFFTHHTLTHQPIPGGSLDRVLWGCRSGTTISTSWIQRIQILLDVADGLTYLHLVHKSVHFDLKSPNILLEKIISNDDATRCDDSVTHRAKIADFGFSRIFTKGKTRINITKETSKSSKKSIKAANWISVKQKGFVGTPRWMAPEMMKGQVKIGPSADIYSFGVVMWEVWARRKPWSKLSDTQEIFRVVHEEKKKLPSLEKQEDEVPDKYDGLMRRCCKYKANQRPLVDVVRGDLQDILEKAAEIDRERTLHLGLTCDGSIARENMLIKLSDDGDVETKESSSFDHDPKAKEMRRDQIEMETFSPSSDTVMNLIEEGMDTTTAN
jgi:serine/threonine protein kinase